MPEEVIAVLSDSLEHIPSNASLLYSDEELESKITIDGPCWFIPEDFKLGRKLEILNCNDNPIVSEIKLFSPYNERITIKLRIAGCHKRDIVESARQYDLVFEEFIGLDILFISGTPEQLIAILPLIHELDPLSEKAMEVLSDSLKHFVTPEVLSHDSPNCREKSHS